MTSIVKVTACCGDDKEVKMSIEDSSPEVLTITLQDGESREEYVYDDRVITVKEVLIKEEVDIGADDVGDLGDILGG